MWIRNNNLPKVRECPTKQRPFSDRVRIRLSNDGVRALEALRSRTGLHLGKIVELSLFIYYSGNHVKGKGSRGPNRRTIKRLFPNYKTVTVRKDMSIRLLDEARHKAYTCRSFYVGSLFQIVLNRLGFWELLKEIKKRPDLRKALNYGGPKKSSRDASSRLHERVQRL